jgi:hypothetical protein
MNGTDKQHWLVSACALYDRWAAVLMPRVMATIDTCHTWIVCTLAVHRTWKVRACTHTYTSTDPPTLLRPSA